MELRIFGLVPGRYFLAAAALTLFSIAADAQIFLGTAPNSAVVGDFNGDGKPDVAVANSGDNTVTVLLGDGNGGVTAAPGSPFATGGTGPDSLALADFNGDGHLDILVANATSGTGTVLFGTGTGGFTLGAGSIALGAGPYYLVAADFNGDGRPDIAVANSGSGNVSVLLSTASGPPMTAPGSPFTVGSAPVGLIVGDFNGDGIPDLATATAASITVLLGNGSGGFGTPVTTSVGIQVAQLAAGDFNGDGKLDLAVANSTLVTILPGNGKGGFTQTAGATVLGTACTAAACIAVADFNGDGNPDVALNAAGLSIQGPSLLLYLGDGKGGLTLGGATDSVGPPHAGATSMAVGDFNGDGQPDIAVTSVSFQGSFLYLLLSPYQPTNALTINPQSLTFYAGVGQAAPPGIPVSITSVAGSTYTATPTQTWLTPTPASHPTGGSSTVTVSVNPGSLTAGTYSGKIRYAASNSSSGVTNVTLNLANPSGTMTPNTNIPIGGGTNPMAVATGDFNGDGFPDLVTANLNGNSITVLLGNGTGGFTPAGTITSTISGPRAVSVADFNGDGKLDLAVANYNAGNVTILLGNGSGGFTPSPYGPYSTDIQPISIAVGDFNRDGIPDLAIANYGGNNVTILLGLGYGDFTPGPGNPYIVGPGPFSIVVGDFNQDGIQDFAVANNKSNNITVLLGNRSAGFSAATGSPFAAGPGPTSIVAVDFNRDGILDLATANNNTNTVSVLLGNGLGGFAAAAGSPITVNAGPISLVAADFNGDGVVDLGVDCTGSNSVYVLLGSGSGGFAVAPFSPVATGLNPHFMVAADFNNDGRPDLAVPDFQSNSVSVLLGRATGQTAQTITFNLTPGAAFGTPITIGATASSALAVSFASVTPSVCSVSGVTVTFLSIGNCSIAASQPGNGTFAAAPTVVQTCNVFQGTQTITFGPLPNVTFGVAPFALTATASSGLPVSYMTSANVCTISGSTVTIVAVGTCTVTENQAGNANYSAATPVMQSFTVAALSQTITFDTIPNQILGISPFPIAAESSSRLPVGFVVTTPTVCKLADDLLTLLKAGTCSISANQGGTTGISAAPTVTRSFTVSTAKPSGSFIAALGSPFAAGAFPDAVAVGDFNGDGIPDLAIADQYPGNSVTVLLSNGTGGFAAAPGSPFAVGGNPFSVAVGDFNGDGIPDLVTANSGSNNVTVLLGNGSGAFTPAPGSPFSVGTGPAVVAVGDFNGDDIQDLVIANQGSNNITLLSGNGAGGFIPAVGSPFAVGSLPVSLAVGDFNGDGMQDLAVVNSASNNVTVLLGNGGAGFTQAAGSPFTMGNNPRYVVVGDFNGDGIEDLAATDLAFGNNVTVALGNGSGGFTVTAGSPYAVGALPFSMVVGDFNGDGIQDLVTANNASNNLTVLLGNGSGGFTPATGSPFAVGSAPIALAVGDFNGDGIEDIATANESGNNVTMLLGQKAGNTSQTITFGTLSIVVYGVAPFAISATASSGLTVGFASGTSSVCTVAGNVVTVVAGGTCTITASQAGNATYAAAATVTQSFIVNRASQTITFAPLSNMLLGVAPFAVTATASSGLAASFVSTTTSICTVSGSTVTIVAAGTCSITASQAGNASYSAATSVTQSFTVNAAKPSEVGVFRQGYSWLLDANGNRVFDGAGPGQDYYYANFISAQTGDIPVVGDWSGSGTTKIGIYRPSGGQWFLDVNGNGVYDAGDVTYNFGGIAGDKPVVGDWSGSGTSKIGIFRSGFFWLLDYNGNGTFDNGDQAFAFGGIGGDVPVTGDWTGDGKAKVGVVRVFVPGGTPAFWILDANNDHSIDVGDLFFAFGGITGDVPVVGDWNNTGFAKAGMLRQGFFWVIDNNGSAPTVLGGNQVVAFGYGGVAGDIPVVGRW